MFTSMRTRRNAPQMGGALLPSETQRNQWLSANIITLVRSFSPPWMHVLFGKVRVLLGQKEKEDPQHR